MKAQLMPSGIYMVTEVEPDNPNVFDCKGYAELPVLPYLKGHPYNDLAKRLIHSLRPSVVRVSYGEVKCDAICWRVTVMLDKNHKIELITQEVEVGGGTGADLYRDMKEAGVKHE